ncbi:hypothetical protein N9850_11955, partial [Granulosicoccus sp.]
YRRVCAGRWLTYGGATPPEPASLPAGDANAIASLRDPAPVSVHRATCASLRHRSNIAGSWLA